MKRLFLILLFLSLILSSGVIADTVYITSENYNDTLLSELTADSIIIVDTSLEVEQLIKISYQVGVYETVTEIGKPAGYEYIKYNLPLKEKIESNIFNFIIDTVITYTLENKEFISHKQFTISYKE
jgi:hypothetical protein